MLKGDDPDELLIFLNEGYGLSWTRQTVLTTGCYSLAAGDVDTDGDVDLVSCHNWDSGPIELWLNDVKQGQNLNLARWKYFRVDSTRAKWGDWGKPEWLKYFGLGFGDADSDGDLDLVSGRYFYLNPGADMSGAWSRVDLGLNVDAMLLTDVDGDSLADIIGQALPDIWWLEAADRLGNAWTAHKVASQPPTDHGNGQGYLCAQIVPGGRPEIVLIGGDGISYFTIPDDPLAGEWPRVPAAPASHGPGDCVAAGDIDRDGLVDLAGFDLVSESERTVSWWKNPGNGQGDWAKSKVGRTDGSYPDRIALADLNGDGRIDVVCTEEEQVLVPKWENLLVRAAVGFHVRSLDPSRPGRARYHQLPGPGGFRPGRGHRYRYRRAPRPETSGPLGEFRLGSVYSAPDRPRKGKPSGARAADLDRDGDLDLVGICWDSYQELHLWRNDAIK